MGENICVIPATKGGLRTDVCSSDLNYHISKHFWTKTNTLNYDLANPHFKYSCLIPPFSEKFITYNSVYVLNTVDMTDNIIFFLQLNPLRIGSKKDYFLLSSSNIITRIMFHDSCQRRDSVNPTQKPNPHIPSLQVYVYLQYKIWFLFNLKSYKDTPFGCFAVWYAYLSQGRKSRPRNRV